MPRLYNDNPEDFDVYLSYNSKDRVDVLKIAEALKDRGIKVWLNIWELETGSKWEEVESIVQSTKTTAVLLGKNGIGSWQKQDIAALEKDFDTRNTKVFPVLLPGAPDEHELPEILRSIKYLDLREIHFKEGVAKLINAIKRETQNADQNNQSLSQQSPPNPAEVPPPTESVSPDPASEETVRQYFSPEWPATPSEIFGREKELAMLDSAWDSEDVSIITLVAARGVGKTALLNHWGFEILNSYYDRTIRIFGWTFNGQGTGEGNRSSADAFIDKALRWFGDEKMADSAATPFEKGKRLSELVKEERALLLLDGLEPIQEPLGRPAQQLGRVTDEGLRGLLILLALNNPGLCVLTTRIQMPDLNPYMIDDRTVSQIDLADLTPEAGAEYLRSLGVHTGTEDNFLDASKAYGNNAGALTLLGRYLVEHRDGDVRNLDGIPDFHIGDENNEAPHHQNGAINILLKSQLTITTISADTAKAYEQITANDTITLKIGHKYDAGQLVLVYIPEGHVSVSDKKTESGFKYLFITKSPSKVVTRAGTNIQYEVDLFEKVTFLEPLHVDDFGAIQSTFLKGHAKTNFARTPTMKKLLPFEDTQELWELLLQPESNLATIDDSSLIKTLALEGNDAPPPPETPRPEGYAAYKSDHVLLGEVRDDHLSIEREINAFSSLICAEHTPLPLAIGLFGNWGSGKSHFMGLMQNEIDALSKKQPTTTEDHDSREGTNSNYCKNVAQITFNAWQYVDTHLWASLVSHIYHELANEMYRIQNPDETDPDEKERKKLQKSLLEDITFTEEFITEKRERRQILDDALKQAVKIRNDLSENESGKLELLTKTLFTELVERSEFKNDYDHIKEQLQITQGEFRQVQQKIQDLAPIGKRLYHLFKVKRPWTLGFATLSIIFAVLAYNADVITFMDNYIQALIAGITPITIFLRSQLSTIKESLDKWSDFYQRINSTENQERTNLDSQIQKQIDKLKAQQQLVEDTIESAVNKLEESGEKFEALSSSRQLYDHILEQGKRSEYKSELGIMSVIHNDFQQLNKRLKAVKNDTNLAQDTDSPQDTDTVQDTLPKIDRIVLYIDDLDRCPSKKIVEVLQAVHLMMAFDLFVVVVGVDPRWLVHALQDEYTALNVKEDKNNANNNGNKLLWKATPQNYLEKIFQIPFTIRPMSGDGYRDLLTSIWSTQALETPDIPPPTESSEDKDEAQKRDDVELEQSGSPLAPPMPDESGVDESREMNDLDIATSDVPSGPPSSSESDVKAQMVDSDPIYKDAIRDVIRAIKGVLKGAEDTSEPENILFTLKKLVIPGPERKFIKKLDKFVPTPRATIRITNIYSLLRALLTDDDYKDFENNNYKAAATLLAILTGFPDQAFNEQSFSVFRSIYESDKDRSWTEFIKTLNPVPKKVTEHTKRLEKLPDFEQQQWKNLHKALHALEDELPETLEPFKRYIPYVARFNFKSARILENHEIP